MSHQRSLRRITHRGADRGIASRSGQKSRRGLRHAAARVRRRAPGHDRGALPAMLLPPLQGLENRLYALFSD